MPNAFPTAFLLDVDNTLIDSDRIIDDLREHLASAMGAKNQQHYWDIFAALQEELGYADYFGALQRYRCENPRDPHFVKLSLFLLDYPYADRLFPKSLDVIEYLSARGVVSIVSNGDAVFQPRKIERSGLLDAVKHHLLLYIHKERDWDDVERHFPAQHYVLMDDEPEVLVTAKQAWKNRVTTIFMRQGRHAHKVQHPESHPAFDLTVNSIGELLDSSHRHLLNRM